MTSQRSADTETRPVAGDIPKTGWLLALGAVMISLGVLALSSRWSQRWRSNSRSAACSLLRALQRLSTPFRTRGGRVHLADLDWRSLSVWRGSVLPRSAWRDLALTIYLGVVFFVDGVFLIVLGVRARPAPRWGAFVLSGVVSILLALYVFFGIPLGASLALLGVLLGVNFILWVPRCWRSDLAFATS